MKILFLILWLVLFPLASFSAVTANAGPGAGSGVDAASYATASWTPTTGCFVVIWVSNVLATTPSTTLNTVTGNNITWSIGGTDEVQANGSDYQRITLVTGLAAAPSAGTITFDFNSVTQLRANWSVVEFCGIDPTSTLVQSKVSTPQTNSASHTVTLDAGPTAGNATAAGFINNINADVTVEMGWTELHDFTGTGSPTLRTFSQWITPGDQSSTATNGNAGSDWVAVAVEIKALASGGSCRLGLLGVGC